MTKIINSRDFNQDVSSAKRMADHDTVVITDRGKPAYVLMRHEAYMRLTGEAPSILDLLADPDGDDIDFEPRRLTGGRIRSSGLD